MAFAGNAAPARAIAARDVTLIVVLLVPGSGAIYACPFDRVAEILIGTLAAVAASAAIRPKLWRRGLASVAARPVTRGGRGVEWGFSTTVPRS